MGADVDIQAQLYQSTTPNNTFTAIAATLVTLTPTLSGLLSIGDIVTGSITGLNVVVPANTRMLLVISSQAGGANLVTAVSGYVSAGTQISM